MDEEIESTEAFIEALHDAVLSDIELDWESGTLSFTLHVVGHPEPSRLTLGGVVSFRMDRHMPWGPSVHVNTARTTSIRGSEALLRLELEMQSGDTLAVEFTAIEVSGT